MQKSHLTHAEEHEPDLEANKWISQIQSMMDELPEGKQQTKHLHDIVAALYDPLKSNRADPIEKEAAEDIRAVSLPRSRNNTHRQTGDIPAGEAWGGPHKGTGFDPKPNKGEWKVR